jgi:GT2 family glycosyltransferase
MEPRLDATIVIPTHDRSATLRQTLVALSAVDHPAGRWEAVVVDDGSRDATPDVLAEWEAKRPGVFRHVRQDNAGAAAARNRGAREARGRFLLFIDNDIHVPSGFVARHLDVLTAHPGCWVVGRVTHPAALRGSAFGRYRDDAWESFHRAHAAAGVAETDGMTAANLALPAEDFRRLGGFDESFTIASSEDWDLGFRARAAGIRILYDPENVVVHDDWAASLPSFCERQRLYSLSDVLLWRKHGGDSPRRRLIQENAALRLGADPMSVTVRKLAKGLLATRPGRALLSAGCALMERMAPDTPLSRRAYDLAVAVAIFRGVREGLQRYPAA